MRLADRNGGQLHQIGYRGQYPLAALAAAARAALRPLGPTGLALRPVEVDRSTQTHPKVTMGHPNPPHPPRVMLSLYVVTFILHYWFLYISVNLKTMVSLT